MAEAEALSLNSDRTYRAGLMNEEAFSLFAFTDCADALQRHLPDATIEHRLVLHRIGTVAALVGAMPSSDYCGAESERHMIDIAWLAPRARRHAELVAWAAQWSTIFPFHSERFSRASIA